MMHVTKGIGLAVSLCDMINAIHMWVFMWDEIEIHPNSKHMHVHGDHKKGPPQCLSIIIIW